jgi:hypothetical protein
VPRTLKASVVGHVTLAERREQVPAAVGQRKWLALADANGKGAVGCPLDDGDL